MDPPSSKNIVLGAGIGEVVELGSILDTLLDETQAVLPDNGVVDRSLADEKLALEVGGVLDEACLLETFWIRLRSVHVALTIHNLVPFPVDDGSACDSYLEGFGIMGHE